MLNLLLFLATQGDEIPSMGWLVVKTIGLLALLALLMFVLFKYGGRLAQLPFMKQGEGGPVTLGGTLRLDPGRSIHLVRYGTRGFLIGSSEKGLELLAEVDPPARTPDRATPSGPPQPDSE